jgi:hypothetical protein
MRLIDAELITIEGKNYLLSPETNSELFVFCVNNELTIGYFDDLLGDGIQWVKNIAVEPEQIGMMYEETKLNGYHKIIPITPEHIEAIKQNGGKCKIEMDELLSTVHDDLTPNQKIFEPILIDNKVIIHL